MNLFAYTNQDEATSGFDYTSRTPVAQQNMAESKDMFSQNIWQMEQNIEY